MLNEMFHENKRKILLLFSVFLIATLAISMLETVSAGYSISDDGKRLSIDLSSGTSETTFDLEDGKKVHVKTYFWYAKRMIEITTEKTPKIQNAFILGRDKYGLQYTASIYFTGGAGSFFTLKDNYIKYESFREGGTPYSAAIHFNESLKSSKVNNNLKADLTISKVTKKGNSHTVFIRNIGKVSAGKSVLGVYDGNKLIKKVNVKAIAKGKTVQVNVPLNPNFKNKVKTFKVDYNNKIKEINKENNVLRVK